MQRDERLEKLSRRIRQAIVREQERFAVDDDNFYCDAIALAFAAFHDNHWKRISERRGAFIEESRRELDHA